MQCVLALGVLTPVFCNVMVEISDVSFFEFVVYDHSSKKY